VTQYGRGHGKVILLGEHAVVYGHAALAGAVALHVAVRAWPGPQMRLLVPSWGIDSGSDPDGAPARAVAAIAAKLGVGPHFLEAETDLPCRAGLGSSAALCVAVTRALAPELARPQVIEVATAGEQVFHGTPSGIDVALAAEGGIGLFRRETGLQPLDRSPIRMAIGLSGEPRDTAARVVDVARLRETDPDAIAVLDELGTLALKGVSHQLGPLFDQAQRLLTRLHLSTPGIDRLCRIAHAAGCDGAKLTGAGGGGAVISVGNEDTVASAWRSSGFQAMVADVGVRH
jgi:mevalonate kinase